MAQKGKTPEKSEEAVSEIVGELMMLVITVMIFVILVATVNSMITKQRTEIVHMSALAMNDTTMGIQHMGGDTIAYSQLAVVINGNLISAIPADKPPANGLWDLGETLYVYGVDTRHSLSVTVYDSNTKVVLGDFTVDTIPSAIPVPSPSASPSPVPSPGPSPSPSPSASPSPVPSPSPSPGPQVTIGGNSWISNVQAGSGSGWIPYTMDVVLQVDNSGSGSANGVMATITPPTNDQGVRNIQLVSTPTPNPRDIARYGNTQYTWRYSMELQQNHKNVVFNLTAQGSNTNTLTKQVTYNG